MLGDWSRLLDTCWSTSLPSYSAMHVVPGAKPKKFRENCLSMLGVEKQTNCQVRSAGLLRHLVHLHTQIGESVHSPSIKSRVKELVVRSTGIYFSIDRNYRSYMCTKVPTNRNNRYMWSPSVRTSPPTHTQANPQSILFEDKPVLDSAYLRDLNIDLVAVLEELGPAREEAADS